jgi:lipoprotein-anchoring transpeptidase ErfK/SrfK
MLRKRDSNCAIAVVMFVSVLAPQAIAEPLSFVPVDRYGAVAFPATQGTAGDATGGADFPAHLRRQIVSYPTTEPPNTVIIDTANTALYLTLGNGRAIRYGIGVGREGFTWSGIESISRKAEWPDWIPPAEMIARQPYLPRWVGGGPGNPLGARALYLGHSAYRIHGTNDPTSIGKRVSSGCIRMRNEDVIDLYERVGVGTKVVVLADAPRRAAAPVRSERIAARVADTPPLAAGAVYMTPASVPAPVPYGATAGHRISAFGLY